MLCGGGVSMIVWVGVFRGWVLTWRRAPTKLQTLSSKVGAGGARSWGVYDWWRCK